MGEANEFGGGSDSPSEAGMTPNWAGEHGDGQPHEDSTSKSDPEITPCKCFVSSSLKFEHVS
jgi:hypothetical protein